MERAKGKRIFKTICMILFAIWWIFLIGMVYISEQTATVTVKEDPLIGLGWFILIFVFLMILLSQLGIYRSIGYFIFEPQKKWWKVVLYATILPVSLATAAFPTYFIAAC